MAGKYRQIMAEPVKRWLSLHAFVLKVRVLHRLSEVVKTVFEQAHILLKESVIARLHELTAYNRSGFYLLQPLSRLVVVRDKLAPGIFLK